MKNLVASSVCSKITSSDSLQYESIMTEYWAGLTHTHIILIEEKKESLSCRRRACRQKEILRALKKALVSPGLWTQSLSKQSRLVFPVLSKGGLLYTRERNFAPPWCALYLTHREKVLCSAVYRAWQNNSGIVVRDSKCCCARSQAHRPTLRL